MAVWNFIQGTDILQYFPFPVIVVSIASMLTVVLGLKLVHFTLGFGK